MYELTMAYQLNRDNILRYHIVADYLSLPELNVIVAINNPSH
ncbi:hypothetical protein [Nitrosomonas sp. PY1]|nr:hypothetical protein [Nitrosomonas sp. PY1]